MWLARAVNKVRPLLPRNTKHKKQYILHRGIDQNIFLQKIFVKACVGARGPDWIFPDPK